MVGHPALSRAAFADFRDASGKYLIATPAASADAGFRIVFETDGASVLKYRAGRLPEVEWVEGCA